MAEETVLAPRGGLNQDSSLNVPPIGSGGVSPFNSDYRYSLNLRIGSSIEDNIGACENIPSTLLVNNYYIWNGSAWISSGPLIGGGTAIGSFVDDDEGAIYWMESDGLILKYLKSDGKIYQLLNWEGLNVNQAKHVAMCKIGPYLIFTNKSHPPRIIDVTSIFNLKFILGSNFSEFHISFAKWAPLPPPLVRRNTVGQSDFVEKGIFQFRYRYVYLGGFSSTWSPPSWFVTNEVTDDGNWTFNNMMPGFLFDYDNPANTAFQHSSIKFYQVVQYIELAYRESDRDVWKLWKRHTVDTGTNTSFDFENNGPSARIPQIEADQPFDSVPFFSGAVEAIDNRPNFGDNEDELPGFPEFDVENIETYSKPNDGLNWNGNQFSFSSLSFDEQIELSRIIHSRQFSLKERGIYKLGIIFQHYTGRTGLVTTLDKWTYLIPDNALLGGTISEFNHALGFNIPAGITPPDWAVAYQIVRTNCLNFEFFIQGAYNRVIYLGSIVPATPSGALATPQEIQDITNDFYNNTDNDKLPLSQRIADWYRNEVDVGAAHLASRIYFDITNWTQESNADASGTSTNPSNNLFYNFQKGDRVRFIGVDEVAFTVFDELIVGYTGTGIIINKPATLTSATSSQYSLEIYRPKKLGDSEDVIFYEIGEWYPITQPTTPSRDFSKRDFRWTNPALVTQSTVNGHVIYNKMPISNGDVWIVNKTFYRNYNSAFGSSGVSPFVKWAQMNQDKDNAGGIWEHNTGRPLAAYRSLPAILDKPTQVRFGGKYFLDGIYNGINTFMDEWQFIYPAEYGRIRALVNTGNAEVTSVGSILMAIGEVEAWSIYVNRTTLEDLSGHSQVALSTKVLGSFNKLLGQQGTLNPESVSKESDHILWWNAMRGEWCRYSRDGITPISKFGMKNWFKDISDLLIDEYATATPPRVLSVFDDYHEEWITRIDHASLPATFKTYASYKCVSFAERNADKRWKSFYDYAPDLFVSLYNDVYSIIGITIHIHEKGADFNSIYGVKKDSMLELVANDEVRKNKTWKVVALETSDKWSFEKIIGDWRSNGAVIQESRLNLDDLEKKEDTYWTPIKRDKNSPNAASEMLGVTSGEAMRSKTLRLLMKLDPAVTWLSVFNYLVVLWDPSEKNPKN